VFSLGAVLHEMLAGRRPFPGGTPAEQLECIVEVEARPPRQLDAAIPAELERMCLKALAKRPSERYPTAGDMAHDLRQFLSRGAEESPKDAGRVEAPPNAEGRRLTIALNARLGRLGCSLSATLCVLLLVLLPLLVGVGIKWLDPSFWKAPNKPSTSPRWP